MRFIAHVGTRDRDATVIWEDGFLSGPDEIVRAFDLRLSEVMGVPFGRPTRLVEDAHLDPLAALHLLEDLPAIQFVTMVEWPDGHPRGYVDEIAEEYPAGAVF